MALGTIRPRAIAGYDPLDRPVRRPGFEARQGIITSGKYRIDSLPRGMEG